MFFRFLVLFFLLFSSPVLAKNLAPDLVKYTAKVYVSDITGSAVAVLKGVGGTFWITNDHVCQSSRGTQVIKKQVGDHLFEVKETIDYGSPLNSSKLILRLSDGRNIQASVVKTSDMNNPIIAKPFYPLDLCLLFTTEEVDAPNSDPKVLQPYVGQEVLGIGAAHGIFPSIHGGYMCANYGPRWYSSAMLSPGSSGGGVFDKDTGHLVGISYAIAYTDYGTSHSILIANTLMWEFFNLAAEAFINEK